MLAVEDKIGLRKDKTMPRKRVIDPGFWDDDFVGGMHYLERLFL